MLTWNKTSINSALKKLAPECNVVSMSGGVWLTRYHQHNTTPQQGIAIVYKKCSPLQTFRTAKELRRHCKLSTIQRLTTSRQYTTLFPCCYVGNITFRQTPTLFLKVIISRQENITLKTYCVN